MYFLLKMWIFQPAMLVDPRGYEDLGVMARFFPNDAIPPKKNANWWPLGLTQDPPNPPVFGRFCVAVHFSKDSGVTVNSLMFGRELLGVNLHINGKP